MVLNNWHRKHSEIHIARRRLRCLRYLRLQAFIFFIIYYSTWNQCLHVKNDPHEHWMMYVDRSRNLKSDYTHIHAPNPLLHVKVDDKNVFRLDLMSTYLWTEHRDWRTAMTCLQIYRRTCGIFDHTHACRACACHILNRVHRIRFTFGASNSIEQICDPRLTVRSVTNATNKPQRSTASVCWKPRDEWMIECNDENMKWSNDTDEFHGNLAMVDHSICVSWDQTADGEKTTTWN